jgi:hypothetical protein
VAVWLVARPADFAPGFIACWQALKMLETAHERD